MKKLFILLSILIINVTVTSIIIVASCYQKNKIFKKINIYFQQIKNLEILKKNKGENKRKILNIYELFLRFFLKKREKKNYIYLI